MNLNDERGISIVALIMSLFVVVTLDQRIGLIYFGMAVVYAFAVDRRQTVPFFSGKSSSRIAAVAGFLVIAFVAVATVVLSSQEAFVGAVVFSTTSFLTNFTITDPLIRLLVFGVFVSIIETMFFFGAVFPYIKDRTNATDGLNVKSAVLFVMVAGIATAFHFAVALLNDASLISDLIFFGISSVIVFKQKELSGAALGHVVVNTYFMAVLLNFVPKLI